MNSDNYLNLSAHMRDKFVYRIISIERLFELFASRQNVLVKPKKWEDPFENFILRCRIQLPDGRYATFGFQDKFYAQCWTFQSASDAMWRIYSRTSDAVRVRSTIRKLFESLRRNCGEWARDEAFIGRVEYLDEKKLERFAKGVLRSDEGFLSMRLFAGTLLVKRPAFRHEREVRLIFTPHDKNKADSDLFPYPVNPNELIDQIMIDPRMSAEAASSLKKKIGSRTGFSGHVVRSLLYAPPPSWVIPL
jgi:hypothetical protein